MYSIDDSIQLRIFEARKRDTTMMLKLALVACLGLGAYAQTTAPAAPPAQPPAQAQPQVPEEVMTMGIYTSLLSRMAANERLSDRVEAANKDPQHQTRKWLQIQTGLTDQEFTLVRSILLDGISSTKALKSQQDDIASKSKTDNGGVVKLTVEQKKSILALHQQREQMVLDHVKQIETALGPSRFQQFDTALRKSIGSSVKVIPLQQK
jgi:hypothetical protein